MAPWLRPRASTVEGMSTTPGRGTEIPHALREVWPEKKRNKKSSWLSNRLNLALRRNGDLSEECGDAHKIGEGGLVILASAPCLHLSQLSHQGGCTASTRGGVQDGSV